MRDVHAGCVLLCACAVASGADLRPRAVAVATDMDLRAFPPPPPITACLRRLADALELVCLEARYEYLTIDGPPAPGADELGPEDYQDSPPAGWPSPALPPSSSSAHGAMSPLYFGNELEYRGELEPVACCFRSCSVTELLKLC